MVNQYSSYTSVKPSLGQTPVLNAQLYEQASGAERSIKFTFATPTAFRQVTYKIMREVEAEVIKQVNAIADEYAIRRSWKKNTNGN